MPSYEFIGAYARFYPQERDANGQSLMAELGTVHDWETTPEDGQWVLVEASNQPDQGADMGASAEPEPVQEPEPAPAPDQAVLPADPPAEPITPEAPVEPENAQVTAVENTAPDPVPAPVPAFPAPAWSSAAFPFPGFAPPAQPYTR